MIQRSFFRLGYRYLSRRPWQTLLMVVGIMLGVAVVVAVDLANASASRAFDLSTEAVAGRATHQITGGPQGLEERVYTHLRLQGVVEAAAPVVSSYISSPQLGGRPLQLLGVDPFAEAPFRDYLGQAGGGTASARPSPAAGDLTSFLTQPGAVFLSTGLAGRYGLEKGDAFTVESGGLSHPVFVAGLLEPVDSLSERALEALILADISTAQEITGRTGWLDRIDLILPDPGTQLSQIEALLPPEALVQAVEARSGAVAQMTAAFRLNLTALSLLALVVGMFLIYNTMTFSVVQRRALFGTLRCLGVTDREVFWMVILEALLVGILGSALGIGLGVLLGQGAVQMVTQTINDLFFVVTVRGVQIPASSLIKGGILGLVATLLTAAPPAREAASIPPRAALLRSSLESKTGRLLRSAAAAGLLLLVAGLALLAIPTRSLGISFASAFAAVVGFALLTPLATRWLMGFAGPLFGRVWGALGRMAPRSVVASLSRTSIAVMALMVAISVSIGVSLMVSSFRSTVIAWLDQTLQGDVYISAPSLAGTAPSEPVSPEVLAALNSWPGVERVDTLRSTTVDSPYGPLEITATDNHTVPLERFFLDQAGPAETLWERMGEGGVLVSEPLANRLELQVGERITLNTERGLQDFQILGVFYDYASTQGNVLMRLDTYRVAWDDPAITAAGVRLAEQQESDRIAREMEDALSQRQALVIRPNRVLREDVLAVFDRTFAITAALQMLATVVAFVGVLSALLSLELERQRERGILRAVGLTVRQMFGLIFLETGLMGAVAGLLAMPTGYVLAWILVYIINRRSFGWTLQMDISALPFIQAFLVSLTAALLAGVLPAIRLSRKPVNDSIRYE